MREHFLLDPDIVFLNHGSYGATPHVVMDALSRWQREMERNPVEFLGRRSGQLLGLARAELAGHVGARAEDLVFVTNTTTGVNAVARSIVLEPGDEVLATDHEYGACDATWQRRCAESGASYRRVPVPLPFEPERFVARLLDAATPRTRLVFASHVTSTTALVFPVAELCEAARRRGILSCIDGAHAPGQLPLDLSELGADYYSGNCHKWLCAAKGSAFLHVRPEWQPDLCAPLVSWGDVAEVSGHTGFHAYTGRTALERRLQWQGTRDLAAFLTVPEAIRFQDRHDWPARRIRCHEMAVELAQRVHRRNRLEPIAAETSFGQMVPLSVACPDAEALRRWLFEQRGIEVPVTQHAGRTFVRVSVQAYNTADDLAALERALAEAGL